MLLERIESPDDLKWLTLGQLERLCGEIRNLLITTVSKTGGHLASNLGVVELTVALHRVFHSPQDAIVWDVGHQCYTHKLLTGRREEFSTLRTADGLSGFPKPHESEHDAFVSGHSGNSISAALGILKAKQLLGEDGSVIAVIGDGSFTNGLAYEGFNNAGRAGGRMIVILNDNDMSISKNVGALAKYLAKIRSRKGYFKLKDTTERTVERIPLVGTTVRNVLSASKGAVKQVLYHSNFFEDFGYTYLGPVDGHDLGSLCDVLERAKELDRPVLIHVKTRKGKGYFPAEKEPSRFHGVSPFDVCTGQPLSHAGNSFSDEAGHCLCELAKQDRRVCVVTAAMRDGTGLTSFFQEYPRRSFDVGIAEGHAVTFCGGLASRGLIPVFAVYSTFLQRGYDQILQDVSMMGGHVVFAVDRAGLVGNDGETHQGVFDVAMLSTVPGMTVYSPSTYQELHRCLETAILRQNGPVAVRYPRGGEPVGLPSASAGVGHQLFEGEGAKTLLISYGVLTAELFAAQASLQEKGLSVSVLKLIQVTPLEEKAVEAAMEYPSIQFYEEGICAGSVAQRFSAALLEHGYQGHCEIHAIDGVFVPQASVGESLRQLALDRDAIVRNVMKLEEETC